MQGVKTAQSAKIMGEQMHNNIIIKSVGYLTFEVRGQVDRQKRVTQRAKIAQRERISTELRICMQGVKTAQSGKFRVSECLILV